MSGRVAFDPAMTMARQALYRFAALTLADPQGSAWESLDRLREDVALMESAAYIRNRREAVSEVLGPGERPIEDLQPQKVLDRLARSRRAHTIEYENTFGLLVSNTCPPYETEFISDKHSYQRAHTLADVSGFYRAFGLTVSESHPDRQDHLVLQLEFMAFLIGLERRSGSEPADRAMRRFVCRAAQVRFFREHLAWWTPAFARLLAHESPDGFYAAAAEFIAALVPVERALLNVEIDARPVAPNSIESPDACEGCHANV